MAVVLPALRLWLLLLNLYGSFKAIKSPPVSQRNTRNGQGPSGRAMQLRKREMKSRLAVWIVWAIISTFERPLDRTVGLLTPFYNEIKCTVLLFLIVSRSHGAEAVFLHLIHPLVRPYVPAVDNILATLQSIFDLLTLILFLPWEYVLHWWHQLRWSRFWSPTKDSASSGECSPDDSDLENREDDRRRLRPRNELRQVKMKEAGRQAQMIFQEIEDAQDRVRTRARSQLTARNNVRSQPVRETRTRDPNAVGLRTRRRMLDYSNGLPEEERRIPGSRSTGVHHLDSTTISQVAPGPQPFPAFPDVSTAQSATRPSPPRHIPTPSSSSQSSHEIWYPPQSAFEAHRRGSPSPDTARRTPSPVYPPLPAAYRFTPRRSDPLHPSPHTSTTPGPVTPTPRRISTDAMSRGAVDAYEGIDQFPGRSDQAGPSASAGRFTTSVLHPERSHEHSRAGTEDFFCQALEPSIQAMDVDMETLSTRDGSSANEESMGEDGEIRPGLRDMVETSARDTRGMHGNSRPIRRSARTRSGRSPSVETDDFGFTIRQNSTASSLGSDPLAAGPARKKPLARTKPALTTTQEGAQADSDDEENIRKKRKLKQGIEGQSRTSAKNRQHGQPEASSLDGHTTAQARRKVNVQGNKQRTDSAEDGLKDRQVGTRVTRASTRQPLVAHGRVNVTKRDRGK